MNMAKEDKSYKTITVVLAILLVVSIATATWFYAKSREDTTDHNSFKYKQSQINECMRNGPTFTDQPTLEGNYQKTLDYCTQLNR